MSPESPGRQYDPLEELCVAQSTRPAHLEEVNLRALSPFHRALLVIDGTVTKFIEAYTLDRLEVVRLSQSERTLPADHPWLAAAAGTKVVAREVVLIGLQSRRFYASATSLILPERLPEGFRRGLESDPGGIGHVLLSSRMENYREVLWYGKERPQNLPEWIRRPHDRPLLSRTYRVIAGGAPVMLINEKFPLDLDSPQAHE